jgi:lysozyme family protein
MSAKHVGATPDVDLVRDPHTADEAVGEEPLSPKAELAPPPLTQALRREYERLFATCDIRTERLTATNVLVDKLLAARRRYMTLETALGTPWYTPAVIHSLEAGLRFNRHLHNGDPLTARTVHVPAGRPPRGRPPFTWELSAQDAMQLKGFGEWEDWSIAGVLYKLEQYNGWGYRQYHSDVLSPYLWSFSTHYARGKYVADGKFNPNAVSQQCGAAVLLRRMVDRGIIPEWAQPQEGPFVRYSGGTVIQRGKEFQAFLNTFPGVELDEDGKLGLRSSDAFRRVTGYRLLGDPRG